MSEPAYQGRSYRLPDGSRIYTSDPKVQARMRLNAAAPDLLEALKEARAALAAAAHDDWRPMFPETASLRKQIDAALEKAEGE